MLNKIKLYIAAHKVISVIVLVVVVSVGRWGYIKITSTSGDTRYVTAKVSKGNIVASVSGTGQVSADSQLDLKPKVSGDIVYIGVTNGQKVADGTLIAELDTTDAQKAVRDAQTNLDSANLSLEKLKIQNSDQNMNADLAKVYDAGFNTMTDTFFDLNSVLNGLDTILAAKNLTDDDARASGKIIRAYRDKALTSLYNAKSDFLKNSKDYGELNSNSPRTDIENILNETYDTTKLLSEAIKNMSNFVDNIAQQSNISYVFTSYQTTLATYTSTINGHLDALLTAETNIRNNKDSSQNANLDLQSAELSVTQKENALQDAKDKLADYFVRAPFAGTVSGMTVKKSDSVSASTVVATLITDKQIAEISMNEVDVAKIKVGEKSTLTFDAIPGLSISGSVEEIDSIGTVAQGVVTYNVKIAFDIQDGRIKPSMSVSAAIITSMKQGALIVPNGTIKSEAGASYVEIFDTPPPAPTDGLIGSISKIAPNKTPVEVGLSNDSQTEIISGIKEGDEIVVRTILPSATTATATAPSLFGGGGNRGGANGGAVRIPRGN